ncbi:MAG: hypothetical protein U0T82_03470 [Bacteroidales bacterium]
MRKSLFLILSLLLPHAVVQTAGAQNNFPQTRDSVRVYTDRFLYISGENIQFTAFGIENEELHTGPVSRILYTELISPSGIKHAEGKYFTEGNRWSGSLSIPSNLISGLYYLKSYTKMMRNIGPAVYSYIPLKVINPNRAEVLNNRNQSAGNLSLLSESSLPNDQLAPIIIECNDTLLNTRDSLQLRISSVNIPVREKVSLCLAVVPIESGTGNQINSKPVIENFQPVAGFLPETRGLSLSGLVKDQSSGLPIPSDRVHLSIMGKVKDYLSVMTDSAGRFYFPLPPLEGKRDVFIFAEDKDGRQAVIQVDNDFCSERIQLPSSPFGLTEQEEGKALELARNLQIIRNYKLADSPTEVNLPGDTLSFYGSPSTIINLDKYIQLPSLEEYINEFLPEVRIRKQDGKKHFMIFGAHSELSIYPPLVLIDWISVPEASKILAIAPERISRIEIVNTPYIKGDMIYGGIVSIVSRKRDFAGIDLTSSGLFIRFMFLETALPPATVPETTPNIPVVKNTLYWEPSLVLNPGKTLGRKIMMGDTPGKYRIICRGITSGGKEVYGSCNFTVAGLRSGE